MPVIEFKLSDLERLIGKKFSIDEIKLLLNRLKGEVENIQDDLITMEITHDRPDMFSVEGIARALKGILEIEVGLPKVNVIQGHVKIQVEHVPKRPYIATAVVRDVYVDDEVIKQMIQLQEKIHQTYGRNRRLVAIGFYDLDLIKPPIRYGLKSLDEIKYVPIGEKRKLTGYEIIYETEKGRLYGEYAIHGNNKVPVLEDSEGNILVIIPVIGNDEFKVTERTKNILIDVTSPKLKPVLDTIKILLYNLVERSASKMIELTIMNTSWRVDLSPKIMNLSLKLVHEYSGVEFTNQEVKKYLEMARHDVEISNENELIVKVAPYRINVLHNVDLIEDILISYGYDKLILELPEQKTSGKLLDITKFRKIVRDLMIGLGFQEVEHYLLTSKQVISLYGLRNVHVVELLNPRSELFTIVRDCIWPQLLTILGGKSLSKDECIKYFEIGEVVKVCEDLENRTCTSLDLAFLISRNELTLTDGLIIIKTFFEQLGVKNVIFKDCEIEGFIKERCTCIYVDHDLIGFIGEVHPEVLIKFNYFTPTIACELNLEKIFSKIR